MAYLTRIASNELDGQPGPDPWSESMIGVTPSLVSDHVYGGLVSQGYMEPYNWPP